MLALRQTLRKRLARPHTTVTGLTASPFSVSTHQSVRQRPTRRTRAIPTSSETSTNGQTLLREFEAGVEIEPSLPKSPMLSPSSPNAPTSPTSPSKAQQPPWAPDSSTSGPYKHVLLKSRSIHHCPGVVSSRDEPMVITSGHLTASTSKLQAQQLSAADKFFSHHHRFLYSAETLRHHPVNMHIPEIIILGSSNVGKSTFLNALVGSSGAARVSQRPGHTTLMNAFGVGPLPKIPKELVPKGTAPPKHSLVLVDTPGYGYRSQASWGDAVVRYLQSRRMLRGAVILLSSEKKLLPDDKWMLRTLAEPNTRTAVILTKADKGRTAWADKCVTMADTVQRELEALHEEFGKKWRDTDGAASRIYITAAGMGTPGKLRNGAGMGGVRAAILEMAGFTLQDTVAKKADTVTYVGPIVSFDDIQWKS